MRGRGDVGGLTVVPLYMRVFLPDGYFLISNGIEKERR